MIILTLPISALLVATFVLVEPVSYVIITVPLVYVMLCRILLQFSRFAGDDYSNMGLCVLFFHRYICGVALSVSCNTVAGDIAPLTRRTSFLSRYLTTNDLGAAIGPVLCFTVAPAFGLPLLFSLAAGFFVVVSVLYTITFRRAKVPSKSLQ